MPRFGIKRMVWGKDLIRLKNEFGLIHLYCGDGKGKTTAAMGLALRAVGAGFRVVIVQFLKDGKSSELKALQTFNAVRILSGQGVKGFTFTMSPSEKEVVKQVHQAHFSQAISWCEEGECDLLILDEVIGAINTGLLDRSALREFLKHKPPRLEIVMTGREPAQEWLDIADYVSEIKKTKHPYDKGIMARNGIEL